MKAIRLTRIIVLIFLILGLLFFTGYQFVVLPVQANIELLKRQIEEETNLFQAISQRDNQQADLPQLNINELQEQLPSQPLVDELILDLEKAELASDSLILNMTFGVSSAEELSSHTKTGEVESNQSEISQGPALPSGVEKVTISMSVQSPSYERLEGFFQALENSNRIVQIENVTFSGQGDTSLQGNPTPIGFTIQISAFYYPNGATSPSEKR